MPNINSFSGPKGPGTFKKQAPGVLFPVYSNFCYLCCPGSNFELTLTTLNFDQPSLRAWQKEVVNERRVGKNAYLITWDPFQQPSGHPRQP